MAAKDIYIALVHPPESGSAYGVTFPDLPGCTSSGETYEDAVLNAEEALAGHVAALKADGDEVPHQTPYNLLQNRDDVRSDLSEGAHPIGVQLKEVAVPKERVNVMIARDLLRKLDEAARAQGVSRSAYIEQAARWSLASSGVASVAGMARSIEREGGGE